VPLGHPGYLDGTNYRRVTLNEKKIVTNFQALKKPKELSILYVF
jgi:hypothetical protein